MNNLVVREYLGSRIEFKVINGMVYANANSMANGFGGSDKIKNWKVSPKTKEYAKALVNVGKIKLGENHLVKNEDFNINNIFVSEEGRNGGTWIPEKMILNFAKYLNIEFEIWCDEQIETLIREGKVEIKSTKKLEDKLPMEILTENGKALNELFTTIGLSIPKELIVATAINTTQKSTGYDFEEVKLLLNKQDEESYHTKSEICKNVGIKSNKVNMALCELGLQEEGSTSMHPYILTELGKQYAVERSFTNGKYQGYEIKLKKSAEEYIRENLFKLPQEWVK